MCEFADVHKPSARAMRAPGAGTFFLVVQAWVPRLDPFGEFSITFNGPKPVHTRGDVACDA